MMTKNYLSALVKTRAVWLILCLIIASFSGLLYAQEDEDCMMCHEDEELTAERNGQKVSMYVDAAMMKKTVHKNLSCIKCHKDANVEDFPHEENLKTVKCGSCH